MVDGIDHSVNVIKMTRLTKSQKPHNDLPTLYNCLMILVNDIRNGLSQSDHTASTLFRMTLKKQPNPGLT